MTRRVSFAAFNNVSTAPAAAAAASAPAPAAAAPAAGASRKKAAPPAESRAERVSALDPVSFAAAAGGPSAAVAAAAAAGAAGGAPVPSVAARASTAGEPKAETVFELFTDGAASGNGTRTPQAGFAVVFADQSQFSGNVPTATFSVCDGRIVVDPATPQLPTNNRAEKLAVAVAILAGIAFAPAGAVLEIVTDSELVVKTFLEYLPARLRRPKPEPLKNPDLLSAINAAIAAAERRGHVVAFRHTRAHQARPPPTAPAGAVALWLGNDQADRAAGAAKKPATAPLAAFGLGRLAGWTPFAP